MSDEQSYRVMVDPATCIGSRNCVKLAPTAFRLNDEGVATVVDPASVDNDVLLEAARDCPVQAISLARAEGWPVYP